MHSAHTCIYEWVKFFIEIFIQIQYATLKLIQHYTNLPHWSGYRCYILHHSTRGKDWKIHAHSHGKCELLTATYYQKQQKYNIWIQASGTVTVETKNKTEEIKADCKTHVLPVLYTELTYVKCIVFVYVISSAADWRFCIHTLCLHFMFTVVTYKSSMRCHTHCVNGFRQRLLQWKNLISFVFQRQ